VIRESGLREKLEEIVGDHVVFYLFEGYHPQSLFRILDSAGKL
jgi:hypothetical protein